MYLPDELIELIYSHCDGYTQASIQYALGDSFVHSLKDRHYLKYRIDIHGSQGGDSYINIRPVYHIFGKPDICFPSFLDIHIRVLKEIVHTYTSKFCFALSGRLNGKSFHQFYLPSNPDFRIQIPICRSRRVIGKRTPNKKIMGDLAINMSNLYFEYRDLKSVLSYLLDNPIISEMLYGGKKYKYPSLKKRDISNLDIVT